MNRLQELPLLLSQFCRIDQDRTWMTAGYNIGSKVNEVLVRQTAGDKDNFLRSLRILLPRSCALALERGNKDGADADYDGNNKAARRLRGQGVTTSSRSSSAIRAVRRPVRQDETEKRDVKSQVRDYYCAKVELFERRFQSAGYRIYLNPPFSVIRAPSIGGGERKTRRHYPHSKSLPKNYR